VHGQEPRGRLVHVAAVLRGEQLVDALAELLLDDVREPVDDCAVHVNDGRREHAAKARAVLGSRAHSDRGECLRGAVGADRYPLAREPAIGSSCMPIEAGAANKCTEHARALMGADVERRAE
jgi:hypothetical protein